MALISAKRRLCIAVESSWGTNSTTFSDYAAIPAEGIQWTPAEDHLARPIQSATFGEKYTGVTGGKGGTLTYTTVVPALTTQADSGNSAAVAAWFSRSMIGCGYSENAGTGTTISGTSSTTTSVNVTDASDIAVGSVLRVGTGVRLVTAVNTGATPDAVTVSPALASAPTTNGVTVYSALTYTATGANPSNSYAFVLEMDGKHYVLQGCNGRDSLAATNARDLGRLTWTWSVNSFERSVSGFSGSFPALTVPTSLTCLGSSLLWGSSTRSIASFGFDPQRQIQPLITTENANGRGAWVFTDEVPQATFQAYRSTDESDALHSDFETPTTRTVIMSLGGTTSTGANFVIAAEVAQLTAYPAETDANGILALPSTVGIKAPSTSSMPIYSLNII
jgi:hypothetical protein